MHTDLRNTIVNLSIASQRLINHFLKKKTKCQQKVSESVSWIIRFTSQLFIHLTKKNIIYTRNLSPNEANTNGL